MFDKQIKPYLILCTSQNDSMAKSVEYKIAFKSPSNLICILLLLSGNMHYVTTTQLPISIHSHQFMLINKNCYQQRSEEIHQGTAYGNSRNNCIQNQALHQYTMNKCLVFSSQQVPSIFLLCHCQLKAQKFTQGNMIRDLTK